VTTPRGCPVPLHISGIRARPPRAFKSVAMALSILSSLVMPVVCLSGSMGFTTSWGKGAVADGQMEPELA